MLKQKNQSTIPSQKYYRVVLAGGLVVVVVLTSGAITLVKRQSDSFLDQLGPSIVTTVQAQHGFYGRQNHRHQFKSTEGKHQVSLLSSISEAEKQPLSATDEAGIVKMREEEKLARDVYLTLAKKYNLSVFENIAQSEQVHMDAIKTLIDKYEIKDSAVDDTVGVFSDSEMQQLYNELVTKGSQSTKDALLVGATIEDLDIYDLDNLIKETNNSDIKLVYERLTWGSENHLRAFIRNLNEIGVTYQPEYISQERYEAIINTQVTHGHRGRGRETL